MISLVINPGSTSTKVAVFENDQELFGQNISHPTEELAKLSTIDQQYQFRKDAILHILKEQQQDLQKLDLIMSRGGLLKPLSSGVYQVNTQMIDDLKNSPRQHASNLAAMIALDIAEELGINAYIADPVVVDELQPLARYSGNPLFPRRSIFHALNQKAISRQYANDIERHYEDLNLIVVHMGGGISVGAHEKGQVVDVNQALDGEGPFSPERSGTLPVGDVIRTAFSGKYSEQEMLQMVVGKGGMVAYLGTNDAYQVELNAQAGDAKAMEFYEAMAYQVAKEIGSMSTVLKGKVDAILLTGGLAKSRMLTKLIEERVAFLSEVKCYPGEDEMKALAFNGMLLSQGELEIKKYQ
ncbi:butyrate kinase [Algivirga pacifica]|uniref:Probable butyrate kinase n=1 Tax=Algivirga pacifica TaxID=1162670 RepID=A0ABP9DQF1_9BACT